MPMALGTRLGRDVAIKMLPDADRLEHAVVHSLRHRIQLEQMPGSGKR